MDDTISRRDAIANYQHVCITVKCVDCPFRIDDGGFTDCRLERFLHALPSAQRKGKWIMHIDDLFPVESTMECSKCHHEQSLIIDDNFCPNCGASMERRE